MDAVPNFLQKAAGIRSTDPVVIAFYGESGSDHLRWRSREEGGGAQPVLWRNAIAARVEARLADELNKGRQLASLRPLAGLRNTRSAMPTAWAQRSTCPTARLYSGSRLVHRGLVAFADSLRLVLP